VLIHEMGGTMESWDLWRRCFAASGASCATTRAARASRRRSAAAHDRHDDRRPDRAARRLGITEKVALAGTAVGGAIALHTAFRFPERVAAAIVTSPATSIPPATATPCWRVAKFESDGPAHGRR
jgi:3-oxoadipate enol-lactonase